jgi:hypothetical protein
MKALALFNSRQFAPLFLQLVCMSHFRFKLDVLSCRFISLARIKSEATIPTFSTAKATAIAVKNHESTGGFALTYTLTFLGIFVGLIVINMLGNGLGLFPSKINPAMSDRPWKTRRLADHVTHHDFPQVLVMGSSRMMQVQPPYLAAITGKKVFNYAVSAGNSVDWLTQLQYALKLGVKPELIIVGVDEFAFGNIFNRYELQTGANWDLFKCVPFPENVAIAWNAFTLIDLESTRSSISVLAHPPKLRLRSMKQVNNIMLDDGYLIYRSKVEAQANGTYNIRKVMRNQATKWRLALQKERSPIDVLRPTERKLELFNQFLDLARANGIEVRVLFLPLQPDYEKAALTPVMRDIRSHFGLQLQMICTQHACIYRDFTSLASFSGSRAEFWDGAHQTPVNLRRMMNALFDLPPNKIVVAVPTDDTILKHLPATTTLNTW